MCAVEESPSPCSVKFSPLSDRPVCSTSGNRRNEEHYSGGWKTPLITSRRAVRYPLDLPPVGGVRFAQIAFSLPGRRSARLRSDRGVISPLVLRLFHKEQERERKKIKQERTATREKRERKVQGEEFRNDRNGYKCA